MAVGVSSYEAVCLYKGRRRIASKGDVVANWRVHKLVIYCAFGLLAGILGGMLGLGGGFILGPLFLEMGIPPQVHTSLVKNFIILLKGFSLCYLCNKLQTKVYTFIQGLTLL